MNKASIDLLKKIEKERRVAESILGIRAPRYFYVRQPKFKWLDWTEIRDPIPSIST